MIPQDAPERAAVLELADQALELGEQAVGIWEAADSDEPPGIWPKAVAMLVYASSFVLDLVKACGVEIPVHIMAAWSALQLLAAGA
jgi:hypothetical protein